MYKVKVSDKANADILNITTYIVNELKNVPAAIKLRQSIEKSKSTLEVFPYSRAVYFRHPTLKREYHGFNVRNYVMFYYIDDENGLVVISRVYHSKQSHEQLLLKEEK